MDERESQRGALGKAQRLGLPVEQKCMVGVWNAFNRQRMKKVISVGEIRVFPGVKKSLVDLSHGSFKHTVDTHYVNRMCVTLDSPSPKLEIEMT